MAEGRWCSLRYQALEGLVQPSWSRNFTVGIKNLVIHLFLFLFHIIYLIPCPYSFVICCCNYITYLIALIKQNILVLADNCNELQYAKI
jgi:hypothetical protein